MIRIALFSAVASLFMSTTALAFEDKTYECTVGKDMPKNVYKVRSVSVTAGIDVPYVEITRHYKDNPSDPNSPIRVASIRGLATIHSSSPNSEILVLGQLRLEFVDGELVGCKQ